MKNEPVSEETGIRKIRSEALSGEEMIKVMSTALHRKAALKRHVRTSYGICGDLNAAWVQKEAMSQTWPAPETGQVVLLFIKRRSRQGRVVWEEES